MRILITGANRGIGLGLAQKLAQRGETVYASVRNAAAEQGLAPLGKQVQVVHMDVGNGPSVDAAASKLREVAFDVIINNAGLGEFSHSVDELDFAEGETIMQVNALGPIRVAKAFAANLREGSKVLNITSRMGSIADNTSGGSLFYRMSKAALNMGSKTLALQWQKAGITVVAVHPGWVRTDMGGKNAPTSVDESVSGIVKVMDTVQLKQSGQFVDFRGAELPW